MSKQYHIKVNGEIVAVSEEVYRAYQQPKWREKKSAKTRAGMEYSYELMAANGYDIAEESLVDEIVEDRLLLETLYSALGKLTDEERSLINALFYQNKSERDIAREIKVSQPIINKRKNYIIEKIKYASPFE